MRWRGARRSKNIEDRRGESAGPGFRFPFPGRDGGGFQFPSGGMPSGGRRGGIGGIGLIIIIVLFLIFGGDLGGLLEQLQVGPGTGPVPTETRQTQAPTQQTPGSAPTDEAADFTAAVLGYTEDTWRKLFSQRGGTYREPKLVLFNGAVRSACGFASSATGPFYCPPDQRVFIDLSFFNDLQRRFQAPGDFARAYVIAHEVGHHVQNLIGVADQVRAAQRGVSKREANQLQVMMELQADCYAGLWAHHTEKAKQILEKGDIEEALGAASAIGDDRLQRQTQGHVVPDAFTHGSSEQRVRWFRTGLREGTLEACDTFRAPRL